MFIGHFLHLCAIPCAHKTKPPLKTSTINDDREEFIVVQVVEVVKLYLLYFKIHPNHTLQLFYRQFVGRFSKMWLLSTSW